jgi:hypothetical protein
MDTILPFIRLYLLFKEIVSREQTGSTAVYMCRQDFCWLYLLICINDSATYSVIEKILAFLRQVQSVHDHTVLTQTMHIHAAQVHVMHAHNVHVHAMLRMVAC